MKFKPFCFICSQSFPISWCTYLFVMKHAKFGCRLLSILCTSKRRINPLRNLRLLFDSLWWQDMECRKVWCDTVLFWLFASIAAHNLAEIRGVLIRFEFVEAGKGMAIKSLQFVRKFIDCKLKCFSHKKLNLRKTMKNICRLNSSRTLRRIFLTENHHSFNLDADRYIDFQTNCRWISKKSIFSRVKFKQIQTNYGLTFPN